MTWILTGKFCDLFWCCVNIPGIRDVAEVQWFWTQEEIPDSVLKRCSKKFGPVESNEVFLNVGRNVQREIDPETVLCRCNVRTFIYKLTQFELWQWCCVLKCILKVIFDNVNKFLLKNLVKKTWKTPENPLIIASCKCMHVYQG